MAAKLRSVKTVAVFSHPNHEMAVFGTIQRLQPRMIFLTDGGGQERVNQTKAGLSSIGQLENARFLPYTEAQFYKAILKRDLNFFSQVALDVNRAITDYRPAQVICDAVEFYNPVHDIALPLVLKTVGIGDNTFEIPLVHQTRTLDAAEKYIVQRPPAECKDAVSVQLTGEEYCKKIEQFEQTYAILQDVVVNGLRAVPHDIIKTECLIPLRYPLRKPEYSCILRYDWRARKLVEAKAVKEAITHDGHYLPLVEAMLL